MPVRSSKKKRSDTMNVHNLLPGSDEYRGPEEEEREDSCSQKKDNESENTTRLLAGQKLGVHDYPVNRVVRKATWNTCITWPVSIQCTFVCFLILNSWDVEEYRRLPRKMIRGLVQNYQRLESYGSPTSTVTSAMQEDCLRIGEKGLSQESRYARRTVLGLYGKNLSDENARSRLPARRQGNYHYNRGGFEVRSARYTKP